MRFLRLSCATALAALLVALNLMVAVSFPLELQEQCPRYVDEMGANTRRLVFCSIYPGL